MDNKNVLVTGGCGFIGSDFLRQFVIKYPNSNFINLDNMTYAVCEGSLDVINECPNYKFVKGDITDNRLVSEIFKNYNINIVVNFAAQTHVDNSIDSPEIFVSTNINGTFNLLMNCLKNHAYFHQVSTDEVYGDLDLDSNYLFTESDNISPSSPYSSTKASADLLVLSFSRTYNLKVTISRCSNNYGEFQNSEKLIPNVIKNIKLGQEISLYKDGKNIRDWIYVSDHNLALELILTSKKYGEVFNIGCHNEWSNIDLTKEILNICKANNKIKFVKDRLGHDRRYGIDNTKLCNLGFKCETNFKEKLHQVVMFYINEK